MPATVHRGGHVSGLREPDLFRRYLTAKARGATGSYEAYLRSHFTRTGRSGAGGAVAPTRVRIDPVPGGSHRTNLGLLTRARRWGFEGSYADFMRGGYEVTVRPGGANAPSRVPGPGAAPAAEAPQGGYQLNPLALIALMLEAQLARLEGDIDAGGLPKALRVTGPEPELPSNLDAALEPMPARTHPRLRLAKLLPVPGESAFQHPLLQRIAWLKAQIANHEAELERRGTPERLRTTSTPPAAEASSLSAAMQTGAGPRRNPRDRRS